MFISESDFNKDAQPPVQFTPMTTGTLGVQLLHYWGTRLPVCNC